LICMSGRLSSSGISLNDDLFDLVSARGVLFDEAGDGDAILLVVSHR